MNCKRCGKPLPNRGVKCTFCGMLMDQEQITYQKKMNDKKNERIELLSEKYGQGNNIEYRKPKENKALGLAVIIIVLVFLIVLTILINVIRNGWYTCYIFV